MADKIVIVRTLTHNGTRANYHYFYGVAAIAQFYLTSAGAKEADAAFMASLEASPLFDFKDRS